jgi:hypothetical protein
MNMDAVLSRADAATGLLMMLRCVCRYLPARISKPNKKMLRSRNRVCLVWSGTSVLCTKRSGPLLSAHLACTLLAHFVDFATCALPKSQVGRKTQHLCPTCALRFLCWNHTCLCCRAFYHQLLLPVEPFATNKGRKWIFVPFIAPFAKARPHPTTVGRSLRPTVLNPKISTGRCTR